ncbi:MAG: thiolase domain-containing protein, partial [Paracoccus sp. (in: a-proteobacteria)]|nr:thiolase domain-containing protein [Paracoccus sp. (in: a-proteobacteria)]
MTDPMIVGWSHTRFGKSDAPDTRALMAEAVPAALEHAGISAADVDGIFTGVFNNGFSAQDFQGALVGMAVPELAHVPATRYENACATGSAAMKSMAPCSAAGRGRIALVVGAEKMTATPTAQVGDILL